MTTKRQCEQEKDHSEASFIWSKIVTNRRFTWLLELTGAGQPPLTCHQKQKGRLDVKGDPWLGRLFTIF